MAEDSTTSKTAANHPASTQSKNESVKDKEERLREKLKRKAEDRKQQGSEGRDDKKKGSPTDKEMNDAPGQGQQAAAGRSKKARNRQRRRRRERRQQNRNGPGPGPAMDSRSYYSQQDYYGRYDNYRDGPYRGGGREPVRWERGGYHGNGHAHGRPYDRYGHGRGDYRHNDRDRFGRGYRGGDSRDAARGRSRSRSFSRSRSRGSDRSYSSYSSRSRSRSYSRSSSRSRSRSSDHDSRRSMSRSRSRSASRDRRSSSVSPDPPRTAEQIKEDELTKDKRTIFVSQLLMKADEADIRRYFRKTLRLKVNDVILLRDKRTHRHKGCAYVELSRLEDISRSLEASGKVPDFQRFPILVKASESEKNTPVAEDDSRVEAQKVYVGNIDQNVTQSQLYAIFSQFGQLDRVLLQVDVATGMSKGFAFLSYQDPKVSNLAIVTMSGQILAAKAIKTGWANQNSAVAGLKEVQSTAFPEDSISRIEKANVVFKQLNGTGFSQTAGILLVPGMASRVLAVQALSPDATTAQIATIAEEAVNLALGLTPSATPSTTPLPMTFPKIESDNPKHVNGNLSRHILIRNMFDKDEETEENWADDIKAEFEEEGSKHGKISFVKVMSNDKGGKIYASFESVEGAAECAENLAGRWFDKRQLRVEFVDDSTITCL